MVEISIPEKQCSCCCEIYPNTQKYFPKRSNGRLRADCRECARKRTKDWREEHPNAYAEWIEAHPGYEQTKYQTNKETRLAHTKARYYANPKAKLDKNQEWRDKNPERQKVLSRNHSQRRRSRKRNNGGDHTVDDIKMLYDTQKGLCWWCGGKLKDKYEVDHRVPLSRGGSNGVGNLVISCQHCNRSKRAKLPHEWNGRLL